jgi:DNA-binding MarR family transcriptional regulator
MTIETNKIPAAMSGSKVKVLCALAEAEEAGDSLSMTDLSKMAGVCTAAMTGVVDTLTREGLAQRYRAEGNRQKWLVQLNEEGLELVNSMRAEACGKGEE